MASIARRTPSTRASSASELVTLRRKWRAEIPTCFDTGLTNAVTESFDLKAKLVKRRATGSSSLRSYPVRLPNACA